MIFFFGLGDLNNKMYPKLLLHYHIYLANIIIKFKKLIGIFLHNFCKKIKKHNKVDLRPS